MSGKSISSCMYMESNLVLCVIIFYFINSRTKCKHRNPDQMSLSTVPLSHLPYFFGYKVGFFSFKNNPKNLDPSYKIDLDLWDCRSLGLFRKGKTRIISKFDRADLVICCHSGERNTPSCSQINTVLDGLKNLVSMFNIYLVYSIY